MKKAKKDPKIFLEHVLESINRIENDLDGLSEAKFYKSPTIQDAVIRRLEIIGEAVRNLPDSFRKEYSEISWKKIAGLRDILIHEYFGVDMKLIWKIVHRDMPKFKKQVLDILEKF